ncbi:hypothetical protein [Phenylobacterium sp.]|uniref:hypothetical protein n=1 Tax=Phenylobacterium sp. TaxID=1871053 RepID=UPI00286EA40C|nr:hypothetical protein [Phenylobacterium sp.]
MSAADFVSLRPAVFAASLALGSALVMALVLTSISTPAGFKSRLAAVSDQVADADRRSRSSSAPGVFPVDAVCTRTAERQAEFLGDSLQGYAAPLQLDLRGLEIVAGVPSGRGKLVPVRFRFQASGSYEAAIGLLDALSRQRPQIFADTVDLTSKTSSVTLVFSGRLYCAV